MRRLGISVFSAGLLVALAVPLIAQDTPKEKAPSPAQPATRVQDPARRLPRFFSQVGLTTEQKDKVYTIRSKYTDRMTELRRQMQELTSQELVECETVLTDSQRKLLVERREQAPVSPNRRGARSSVAPTTQPTSSKTPG
jgi:Spy/CpxP family protein refolding chaperone